jgi:ATP-dependent protease ClpP protease subunit
MKIIHFSGTIGGELTPAWLRSELQKMNGGPVELHINSPGGQVFSGQEMIDAVRNYAGQITARIVGTAASMASALAAACDSVTVTDQSSWMIHKAAGAAMGNSDDFQKMQKVLDGIDNQLANLYSQKSGKPVYEILELMRVESWYFGSEILEAGFADSYTETGSAIGKTAALIDAKARFRAAYSPPSPAEIAAYAGAVRTPAAKTRIIRPDDILAAKIAQMPIEEYLEWAEKAGY